MKTEFNGLALRMALKRAGIRQVEFAKIIGVSQGLVSKFLSGKRTPDANTARAIEAALYGLGADLSAQKVVQIGPEDLCKLLKSAEELVAAAGRFVQLATKAMEAKS